MDNRCLFCDDSTTDVCCQRCRNKSQTAMFTHLLSLFEKTTVGQEYYEQMKRLCHKVSTVSSIPTVFCSYFIRT